MTTRPWRVAGALIAAAAGVALLHAQAPPAGGHVFRLYLLDQEIGRETSVSSLSSSGRKLESTLRINNTDAFSATFEAAHDWSPRHLVLRGTPLFHERADLDVTISGGQAQIRDHGATTTRQLGDRLFFPMDGALPVGLQEQLIAYWWNHGRPAEIPSAPGGTIRIQLRAEQQIEVRGRVVRVERLAIEGPVWGRQTAWAESTGSLHALLTWVDGLPFLAVREGYEPRLDQFVSQALRDRMDDLDRLSNLLAPEDPSGVVLTGATVVASAARAPIPDAIVVVRDGRIAAVGPASRVKPPAGLPTLDVRGMTIIPGLWDLDARMSQIEMAPLYLAAGITSIRQTSPDQPFVSAVREALATSQDRLIGPRAIQAAVIDGAGVGGAGIVRVSTEDEGRQAARRLRADGARHLDVGAGVTVPVLRALAADAPRLGLSIGARMPAGFTLEQAAEAGLALMEGLPDQAPDAASATAAFTLWAKSKTAYAPEAAWSELLRAPAGTPADWWQPGSRRLPPSLERRFMRLAGTGPREVRTDPVAILRAAREAGVTLVPGTGPGIPAAGLYRELELFVQAGMTPAEALRAATAIAAELMNAGDSGVIERGKRADLVVLAGNPLDDIANLRTARWVVANGRLYDCAKLWQAAGFEAALR